MSYITIRDYGEDRFIEKKSEFIGYAKRVENEEEAKAFVNEIKSMHKQARHNCWAYVIGENMGIQRYSDDGEPQGTAGIPILEVMKKSDITDCAVVDSAILMNPQTWVASGHLGGFSDPLMDCCECKTRHRADDLIESFDGTNVAGWSNEEMSAYIKEHNIPCPNCGAHNFTDIRQFNLMFKTFQGVTEDAKDEIYLRPETAQGIFVNFANVQRTTRKKIPG